MVNFDAAIPGSYDPEKGWIETLRIEIVEVTPAQMDDLCELVKKYCQNPSQSDPKRLNEAAQAVEGAEFPLRETMSKGMKASRTSKERGKMKARILEFLRNMGPSARKDVQEAMIGKGTKSMDKEYHVFYDAFKSLGISGEIRREKPADQDSAWVAKEAKHVL
jgi:hypothetical protein